MNKEIGKITNKIIKILNLNYTEEVPIYVGDSNIEHMKKGHFDDYEKYGQDIEEILRNPTYLARNEKKKSVEFIKEYKVDNDFVLVAVRITGNNKHFARTMYVMDADKVSRYRDNNYFYKF